MKKGRLIGKILGLALLFLTLCLLPGGLPPSAGNSVAAADGVVTFPDPSLEAAIREAIGKPTGDILQSDLDALTYLAAYNRGITDITGLEYCSSLQDLDLGTNQISDISPLFGLTGLQWLYLYNNQISEISPLSSLTNLQYLYLSSNQIADISPLSSLTNLQRLDLYDNQIADISPLSGLTNLQYLYLGNNQIADISPLSGLTNLQRLGLDSNQIAEISPLSGLTNLQYLYLDNNEISEISPLSGLTNLQYLYLYDNQIADIGPLSGLTNLQYLYLDSNQISEISPLSGLTNLQYLYLGGNQISNISALSGLTGLVALYLDYNQIADISPIAGLTQLGEDTWFPDRDGTAICLGLRGNQVADISPLLANAGLADGDGVDLRENPLSDQSYNIHIPGLEARGVNVLYDAPSPPTIAVDPASLSFSATEGGANPADQTLEIWNSGGGTLVWSVSGDADWLGLSPESDSSTGEHDAVTVSVDISGMSADDYSATITISAPGATNTPQTVPVDLTINPAGAEDNPNVVTGLASIEHELVMVYNFDNATKTWTWYNPLWPAGQNTLDTLLIGKAYWVKVSANCTLLYGNQS